MSNQENVIGNNRSNNEALSNMIGTVNQNKLPKQYNNLSIFVAPAALRNTRSG